MRLENIVWDARDPRRLGTFWSAALNAVTLTAQPDLYEARMDLGDGLFLDLCFPRVEDRSTSRARLGLELSGDDPKTPRVEWLLSLGAERVDTGGDTVHGVVLADPEGNAFRVTQDRDTACETGRVATLALDSADPGRDAAFWAEVGGWTPAEGAATASLRHPYRRGPVLEFRAESEPKQGKNGMHLDVRAAADDGDLAERAIELGAGRIDRAEGLPWEVFRDPSGNEFCILAPRVSEGE